MTLFTRKSDVEIKAKAAILIAQLDELIQSEKVIASELRELVKSNKDFCNVITNFFAIQKKLSIEEARRKEKMDIDSRGTPEDEKY